MKTEDLIAAMSADASAQPAPGQALLPRLAMAFGVSVLAMLVTLGVRPDLGAALTVPVTAAKWVLPLLLAVFAGIGALRLARPDGRPGLVGPGMLAVAAVGVMLLVRAGLTVPPDQFAMAVRGKSLGVCLISIMAFAVPLMIALMLVLRDGASLHPVLSGAFAGLCAGGFSAFIYATHCNEDSPLFYMVWYSLAILIVTLAGALLGRRLLRW